MLSDIQDLNPRWLRIASLVLFGLALLALIGYFVIYVNYAIALFRFPFDYDQGEGFELTDTIIHSQGGWPYRDIESFPFYASNYPPLFHLMIVPLVWVFGPHYWTGRLVGFLMTLVGAASIGWAVYKHGTKNRLIALIAGLIYLSSNYVYHVGPLFRQHMTMVTFETLAIVTLAALPDEQHGLNGRIWLGMLLLLAAGFTKQLSLWTMAAFFTWLGLRGVKRTLAAGVIFSGVAGGLFLLINAATGGYWWLHTISANVNEYLMPQFFELLTEFTTLHAVILLFATGLAAYELYVERLSAFSVWFVFSLINAVMAGKWGAGESYYATTIAAAAILSGIAISRLLKLVAERGGAWRAAAVIIPLLLLVQARLVLHLPTHTPALQAISAALGAPHGGPYYDSVGYTQLGRPPTQADTEAGKQIAAFAAEGDQPAFSEEAGFTLYAGKPVVTNPTQLLNLYNNGLYDPTELERMLDAQAFNCLILRANFYPRPIIDAMGRNYQPAHQIEMNGFVYHILLPIER